MNYRHAFHAGNFADVLKHAVLTLCLAHLGKKANKPFAYIDTHAGIGRYDLSGSEAQRSPEWRDGIARLLAAERPEEVERVLKPYLDTVRALNGGTGELTSYPGSPAIAAHMMGRSDRLHLCELHEADSVTLDRLFATDRRVKVEKRDGYRALKSLLPPKEKRGLVLVDPPFEHRDEMAHMAEAVVDAIPRFDTGTYIFWRPLKDMWAAERFDVGLAEWLLAEQGLQPEKILRADLWVRDPASEGKLSGAGVFVVNPPFTLEEDLLFVLPWLCDLFARDEDAGWRLDGGITEDSLAVDEF
jgi:23S rRNA (adenine2030-N6)-methyltransferase